jgi:hypothetical protein
LDRSWQRCTPQDHELFAAATKVSIGNGKKALFWEATWLDGRCPKDIAPLIFKVSKRKNYTVNKALNSNFWVSQVNTQEGFSVEYIVQFTNLWEMLHAIHFDPNVPDSISWKFTNDGSYSSKTAYKMQFLGRPISPLPSEVWKPWAPPKCKFFAWLIIQNRVWTEDMLQKRGWPNYGSCKLCNQVQETASHLPFKCRFIIRIWSKQRHGLN